MEQNTPTPPMPNTNQNLKTEQSVNTEQQAPQQEQAGPPTPETASQIGTDIIQHNASEEVPESSEVRLLEYNEYSNVNQMLQAASVLIESGVLPNNITEPEQVVGIMKYGNELGLNAMTALNNIHMIQGRPTLGVHIISALLTRNNITYKLVEDFVAVEMNDNIDARTTFRFINHDLLKEYESKLKDYDKMNDATKEAYKPMLDNFRDGIVTDVSYYWSQAVGSGLIEKSNWQKDPRNMMRVRCLATGARLVKSDALLGFYETVELAESVGAETDIPEGYTIETN